MPESRSCAIGQRVARKAAASIRLGESVAIVPDAQSSERR